MTLKQLEAFYWAASCANFALAAQRLHLSISSLSKRIHELEQSLDCALFDRSGRSAQLTAAGEQLLARAGYLLKIAAETRDSVGGQPGLRGRCRLGVSELSAMCWLPSLVLAARARHPHLEIEPRVGIGQVLEQQIVEGELDAIVIAGPSSRGQLAAELVGKLQFVWVASPEMKRQHGRGPSDLLRTQCLVTLPDGAGGTRMLDHWLTKNALAINRRLTCNSWGAVAGLIVDGVGFGFMPKEWADQLVESGALDVLAERAKLPPLDYAVQWRRDDNRPVVGAIRELVRQTIAFPAPRGLSR